MKHQLAEQLERMLAALPLRTDREVREYEWKHLIRPRLRATRLPERFWFIAEKWKDEQRETYEEVKSLLKRCGAIIALVGQRGVGKTTIAGQLIIKRVMNESLLPWERVPPYRKMSDLLATFKALYADFGARDMDELLARHNRLCSSDNPFLVIDELHDCEDQKIKNRFLTDTLDKRYANLVDTIVISNQTPEEFVATTSDSVLSRIKEHGRVIHCTWESWR